MAQPTRQRIVMHVDLDAFFAQVEQREHPEYRGKPVIVGADPKGGQGRGVVSTASYEARKFGIRSGMPISRAWKKCPQAIYLPVNFSLYERISGRIMKLLRSYADRFEQVGIDEAFLDISKRVSSYEEAKALALQIKAKIYASEGLTCSIGIASNKLVAKIASEHQKPAGLTVVRPEEVRQFLSPLPPIKLWGIGPKTSKRLAEMGIRTIGQLAKVDVSRLTEEFGAWGVEFHRMANGIDESPVEEIYRVRSVGREFTFEQDTDSLDLLCRTIEGLVEEVQREILERNFTFRTATVKIRYEDFETHTHTRTIPFPTNSLDVLKNLSKELAEPFFYGGKKIRLVGVRVSNLASDRTQRTLIEL